MRKLIMVFLLFFITGCGKHEIEDYKIVSGIAIDFQDNNYNLTLEVVKGEKTDADFKAEIVKSSGESLNMAIKDADAKMTNHPYLSHLGVIIIGKTALEKMSDILNFLLDSPYIRFNTFIIIAKDEASLLFENDVQNVKSFNIKSSIEKKLDKSPLKTADFHRIMEVVRNYKQALIIPLVDEDLLVSGGAIFDGYEYQFDLLEDYLDYIEIIDGNFKNSFIKLGEFFPKVELSKSKKKINLKEIIIDLEIQIAFLATKKPDIEEMNQLKKELIDNLNTTFKNLQNQKLDPLGLMELFYKRYPVQFLNIQDIKTFYRQIPIILNVTIKVKESGFAK